MVPHVVGVIWPPLRHRENIPASMVSGYKDGEPESAIPSVHPAAAAVFLVLTAAWAGLLVQGYDGATRTVTLPLVGTTLQLGEGPEGGGGDTGEPGATRAEEAVEEEEEEDDDD